MKAVRAHFLSCLCCCFFFAAAGAAPQEPPYRLRVEVALVSLDVAVLDAPGRFVSGLRRENFRVFEDGKEQAVTHFASLEAPLRVVLLVEAGPAVYLLREEHLQALSTLLDHLRPEDAAALTRYDQQWRRVTDFTHDKSQLRARLRELNYALGMAELNLFDALGETLAWLRTAGDSLRGRKAVLLVGTGLDTASRTPPKVLERQLGGSDVTIFAVAMGSLLRRPRAEETPPQKRREKADESDAAFAEADARLRALAEETGGQAYFPRSGPELRAAYREIGERLRHTYSLGYVSTNRARDGAFRSIQIEVVGADGQPLSHRVLARRGYLAPRD